MGKRFNIMEQKHRDRVVEVCTDTRLIVLDTLSRIHTMDENSNSDMAELVATLEYVANKTRASVLYLHHVNKGSARDGQQPYVLAHECHHKPARNAPEALEKIGRWG